MGEILFSEVALDKTQNLNDVPDSDAARDNINAASELHTHPISGVTGLQSALDLKADSTELHSHTNKTALDNISDSGSGSIITIAERDKVASAVTGAENVGTEGSGIFKQALSGVLQFLKIKAGSNTTVSVDGDNVVIDAVQGGDPHNLGWYADLTALQTAHASGSDGDYAICGDTDSFYVWDSDTSAWLQSAGTSATIATQIHNATSKSTPDLSDELGGTDSANGYSIKKFTFGNLKTWILGWFSTVATSGSYNDLSDKPTTLHDRQHAIDSTSDHTGVTGAVENNLFAFDANGLPKDSNLSKEDVTIETLCGCIEAADNKTYVLDLYALYSYAVRWIGIQSSSGSCTAAVQINGTSISGLSSISVSSASASYQAPSGGGVLSAGNKLSLAISNNSSAEDVSFTIKLERL